MTVDECLAGVTREAARALGVLDEIGTLEAGKWCDLAIWDIERPAELVYRIGFNPLHAPCVERAMTSSASIVVKPGRSGSTDLARVLRRRTVVLDPAFWPRVEAAAAIVAIGRARRRAGLRHQYRLRQTGHRSALRPIRPRSCSAI